MKCLVSVAFCILCVLMAVSSCSKPNSRVADSIADSVLKNSFEVTVVKRESKWAVIRWNNVQSPSEKVKYKIYINGTLRKSDLTATSDTIKNISFDTTYAGYVYAYTATKQLAGVDFNLDRLQFEKEKLVGLWNATFDYGYDYRQRFFGADSAYFQDMTNLGFDISSGKWWWGNEDSVYMLITSGRAAYPSPAVIKILNLTTDSLKIKWGTDTRTYYK